MKNNLLLLFVLGILSVSISCSKVARKTSKEAVEEVASKTGEKVASKEAKIATRSAEKIALKDAFLKGSNTIGRTVTRILVSSKNQFITKGQYLAWLAKNQDKIIKTGVKDAAVLRQNMLTVMGNYGKYAKNVAKNGNQAHHIIGNKTPKAAEVLKKCGIDINDPMNGVFLPSNSRSGLRGTIHRGGHTQDYYDYVEQMFSNCKSKNDCYEVLDKIKGDLYKGNIKLYSDGVNKVNKTFRTAA